MRRLNPYIRAFRFRFGQRVRVTSPGAERGAIGSIINGRLYPDGKEVYAVDVPGGSWYYDSSELEEADAGAPR